MSKVDSDLLDNSLDNSGDGDNILGMVDEGSFGSVEEKPQLGSHVLFDTSEEEGGYNFREQSGITQYRLVHMAPSEDDAGISAILQSNSESGSISPTVQTVLTGAGQFYVIGNPSEVFGTSGNAKVLPRETQSTTKAVTKKRDDRRRATHNEVERRRRDKINGWITRLAKLVPATVNAGAASGADGQSKGGILAKACDYITELTENQQRLTQCLRDNERLVLEVIRLNQELTSVMKENAGLKNQLVENCIIPKTETKSDGSDNS